MATCGGRISSIPVFIFAESDDHRKYQQEPLESVSGDTDLEYRVSMKARIIFPHLSCDSKVLEKRQEDMMLLGH